MKYISVLIQHHAGPTGGVLICKNADGVWEFPHDRIRTMESGGEAAERVAWSQLGMKVIPGKLAMVGHKNPQDGVSEHIACGNITHNSNTKCDYHCYYEAVNKWQTEPEIQGEYKWVPAKELGQYQFAGDDASFMAKYDPWINGREIPDQRMD